MQVGWLKSLVLVAFALPAIAAIGTSAKQNRSTQLTAEGFHGTWKLNELPPERLQKLLQIFVDEVYGVGFRYLGEAPDFNHGHVQLRVEMIDGVERIRPFAILYHTQEHAHAVHWKQKGEPRFDYLDVRNRNWYQWLSDNPEEDGRTIVNAREYLNVEKYLAYPNKKNPNAFYGPNVPDETQHYTIHGKDIDPKKIGIEPVGEVGIDFNLSKCERSPGDDYYQFTRGPIQVSLRSETKQCLLLETPVFVEYD